MENSEGGRRLQSGGVRSLPGGLERIKVRAVGTRLWRKLGQQASVSGELEIAASRRGPRTYARSCTMSESTINTGPLSRRSIPVDVEMCLVEEFDRILFQVIVQSRDAKNVWQALTDETIIAGLDLPTDSRRLRADRKKWMRARREWLAARRGSRGRSTPRTGPA